MSASLASSLGIIEPLAATVYSVIIFKEQLGIYQILGIVLVIGAVIVLGRTEE